MDILNFFSQMAGTEQGVCHFCSGHEDYTDEDTITFACIPHDPPHPWVMVCRRCIREKGGYHNDKNSYTICPDCVAKGIMEGGAELAAFMRKRLEEKK